MQLGLIKALYTDQLTKVYNYSEAENLFYITLQWLEKKSKTAVILGQDTLLVDTYQLVLEELLLGKPIQYLTHEAPFYGLYLYVDERVLIPRPETEQLVHWIIHDNPEFNGSVMDIGTGSGCIPVALAKHWPEAILSGCDISADALVVAEKNAKDQEVDVTFIQKDILSQELDDYDIIISNPPYIGKSEMHDMHQNVLNNEPHLALFVSDSDPLIFYKRILQLAKQQKTTCYFETSELYRDELNLWLDAENLDYIWQLDFQKKNRMLKVRF
ncbi:MAG: peptide chain release factor N(5)-glutamine methyltransferase [Bacteroidia bacterium]|jgi:release factor glutamine methyltransferase|nr:peptide chain release factor N(5)-glutamine methyltransferase [Bacteroidia bacterium]